MKPAIILSLAAASALAIEVVSDRPAVAGLTQTPAVLAPAPTEWSAQRRRRPRLRIEVTPSRRLYRACVDWYAVERRPSGEVIVPHMRCWWALR